MRLLTMPCDVRRLVRLRMRPHGDDFVAEALARWESIDTPFDDLAPGPERAPIDARLWLTSWPLEIVGAHLERRFGPPSPPLGDALPPSDAPVIVALARLQRIDPAGFALVVERLRGVYDPLVWRSALGDSEPILDERSALALYRFAVLRADVLTKIEDIRTRVCLAAKLFRGGDASEMAALQAARRELEDASLTVATVRTAAQRGAVQSLELLRSDGAFGVLIGSGVLAWFRRALRLEPMADEAVLDPSSLEPLVALIEREVDAASPRSLDGHPPSLQVAAFAAGATPRDRALGQVEHVLVCRDNRCVDLYRGEVCGRESVTRTLSGPMSEPPPPFTGLGAPGASPHLIRCRDVLWETFAVMARDEGRPVDDLVEEAMDRYRALRAHVRSSAPPSDSGEMPPTTRRSSIPPNQAKEVRRKEEAGRTGLRLGPGSTPPKPLSEVLEADFATTAEIRAFDSATAEEATVPNRADEVTKKRPL